MRVIEGRDALAGELARQDAPLEVRARAYDAQTGD